MPVLEIIFGVVALAWVAAIGWAISKTWLPEVRDFLAMRRDRRMRRSG